MINHFFAYVLATFFLFSAKSPKYMRYLKGEAFCQGLWLNFPKDQLFCLLGPNGAGKTTAINCLTGITPVTSGDGNVSYTFLA